MSTRGHQGDGSASAAEPIPEAVGPKQPLLSKLDGVAEAAESHDAVWLRRAKFAKFCIQVLIAVSMVATLGMKAVLRLFDLAVVDFAALRHVSDVLLHMPTLTLVGRSLAYSAGIELAYMLCTPGPDEAIEPVIVGLAASVLINISDEHVTTADTVAVPVACLAIGFLLFLKRYFHDELNGRPRRTAKTDAVPEAPAEPPAQASS